jgi:hypothetical protein
MGGIPGPGYTQDVYDIGCIYTLVDTTPNPGMAVTDRRIDSRNNIATTVLRGAINLVHIRQK